MESPETPSLKQIAPQRSSQAKVARLLLLAVMLLAFLGGPCAMQDVLPASVPIPTKAEYLKKLNDTGLLAQSQVSQDEVEAMVEESIAFLRVQQNTRARFETPLAVFSLFLVIAYMALFILGARTWRLGNENAARLSKAALVALPARVAVAAVELAVVVNLRPALETLFRQISLRGSVNAPVTGDALLEMSGMLGQSAASAYLVFFWIRTILAVALLYAAYRYFERPDVQALFVRDTKDSARRDRDGDG